ncbi:MAG: polyamine aminopropyltransferase, partial [bacterium]
MVTQSASSFGSHWPVPSTKPDKESSLTEQTLIEIHPSQFWFTELHTPHLGITFRVKEQLVCKQTPYQTIQIFDTYEMGRMLVLDGLVMVSDRDEAAYHEMLVHVPMHTHPHPRKVLIIGGGDGGSLKQVIKHTSVEKVVQVEIDREVVELCRNYFPSLTSAYDHPKVQLIFQDAVEFVRQCSESFDVVIVDGSDPIGPAIGLFQEEFFENIHRILNHQGLVSGQIGSPFLNGERVKRIARLLTTIFADRAIYLVQTPTYLPGIWA